MVVWEETAIYWCSTAKEKKGENLLRMSSTTLMALAPSRISAGKAVGLQPPVRRPLFDPAVGARTLSTTK
jgi:hypothetical protein